VAGTRGRSIFLFIFNDFPNSIEGVEGEPNGAWRTVKRNPTTRVGDLLSGVLKELGLEGKLEEGRLREEWPRIVGGAIAKRSRPATVRGTTLIVEVENNVWMNEIQFHRSEIIRKIHQEFPMLKIEDIRLKLERERERE
jgi:predicted nucleic acid-binding Zn ribbon protein